MDNSLRALCEAVKKIIAQLKPQNNELSFIVITGKNEQGKSALLKQSNMEIMPVFSEQNAKIYFNQQGIIVELGERWLTNSKTLLHNALKQLNRCNRHLKITGLILCIDCNDLLIAEPAQCTEKRKSHIQLLERFGSNLGYKVELALIFTKMDTLAGFTEFYQMDHATELSKPLGFSLDCINQMQKKVETYSNQFNKLIELLNHQVIAKMHPVRSTIKRSLIREFPLQLASLHTPVQSLIQAISPKLFQLHSVYFTSAEQGGVSIDRLNKKIQHEYALIVQDTFPQATNFRAYFVEGALKSIQEQCSQAPQIITIPQKPLIAAASGIAAITLIILSYSHFKTSHLLDEATKELLAYDALKSQGHNGPQALYHLSKAANSMGHVNANSISLPNVHQLKINLHHTAKQRLEGEFLPSLANEVEQVITNPSNTPITRYKALKIYLMLGQPEHFSADEVYDWFNQQWQQTPDGSKNQLTLLKNTLSKPLQNIITKQQIISDARNYLNALPTNYLYYSIAKEYFPTAKQKIAIEGFNLATDELPVYFTKNGFETVIKDIPNISRKLQTENWVLARQDLAQLNSLLIQAYCFDYVTWWQTFLKKSQPLHYQNYQQGRQIVKSLQQSDALVTLITLVQQETKPDMTEDATSNFNQFIAPKFTELNLTSLSSIKEIGLRINELERFISTLSVINDEGKTAFSLTKSRFINESSTDPVSLLFIQSRQFPEPLSTWTRQLAGDTWGILIKETRQYINHQWQQTVFREFQKNIAKRYPFDAAQNQEIQINDFNHFFSTHGVLNTFTEQFIKPFLDITSAEWKLKSVNEFVMPISNDTIDEIIRANIITNMFFPDHGDQSKIDFSLQKISLDPVVSSLHLQIGDIKLKDTQSTESFIRFTWPQTNAKLALDSIEGNHYELAEQGTWAIFKLLEKVNVLVDEQDSSSLQILFEVNSNSGRYLLKTNNQVNPFTPGILNGFVLNEAIV